MLNVILIVTNHIKNFKPLIQLLSEALCFECSHVTMQHFVHGLLTTLVFIYTFLVIV